MIRTSSHSLRFLTISLCSLYQYQLSFSRVDEEVSEQVVDAIFASFDVILSVNDERRERFDVVEVTSEVSDAFLDRSENVSNLDIENFVVVFDEIVEVVVELVDEIDEILFFSLLKLRFEATLFIFFAWCWRTCSWSLFFESKILSQCLQTIFLQTISWVCCNKRINDEKNAKQLRQKWYWDERRETDEFEAKTSNSERDFAENVVIKISSHSLKLFLTISLSFCCLYHVNAESRKHSRSSESSFSSRLWRACTASNTWGLTPG